MSPQEFDLIQRIRIEDGVPRVISTRIQVIEGGEDLMSLAINLLKELGFYDKFEEKRTSQYIGYKLKNPGKGAKRYQLVLQDRKEGLYISIPENFLEENTLKIFGMTQIPGKFDVEDIPVLIAHIWVLPSQEDKFFQGIKSEYGKFALKQLKGEVVGNLFPFYSEYKDLSGEVQYDYATGFFDETTLGSPSSYLMFQEDKLFPYTKQVCIKSPKVLEEFLRTFCKIIMEQN
ncbi:MAG: hypothetical protein KA714_17670 [Limnoraphis sp. WC205]|nr:hypothetical protein [Limnoraphis sp. WC205]